MGAAVEPSLFGSTRRAILALLFGRPDMQFHLRDLVRLTGVGQGAAHRELRQLHGLGIVTRRQLGNLTLYGLNRASPIYAELRSLILKTTGAPAVLGKALEPLAARIDVAFIYGSVARGAETSASDLDLMLVGDLTLDEVVPLLLDAQQDLGREINPTILTATQMEDRLRRGDGFVRRVMEAPKLFVLGGDDELGRLAEFRVAGHADPDASGHQ